MTRRRPIELVPGEARRAPLFGSLQVVRSPEELKASLVPAPKVTKCDCCNEPAVVIVDQDAARFHGFRCLFHAADVISRFAAKGLVATAHPLARRAV